MTDMREFLYFQRETYIVLNNLTVHTKCLSIHSVSEAYFLYYLRYESQIRNEEATWDCKVLRTIKASH